MNPKGSVLLKSEFKATKIWPGKQLSLQGFVDLEKEYKEALAGKMCTVLDIAVDNSGYLVLGYMKAGAPFIWQIEKDDTVGFIPLIKKNGVLVRCDATPMEQAYQMAKGFEDLIKEHKAYTP